MTFSLNASLLWPVLMTLLSAAVSWGVSTQRGKDHARRIGELEKERAERALSALTVAHALGQLDTIEERLGRIETLLMDIPKRKGDS